VNCLSPGFIPETDLSRNHPAFVRWLGRKIIGYFVETRTLDHGGDTIVDLAVNPNITEGGGYYDDLKAVRSSERYNSPLLFIPLILSFF